MEDCFGLARPRVDVHALGIDAVAQLLEDCGFRTASADEEVCAAFGALEERRSAERIEGWITAHRITVLGFSYRLDPADGARACRGLADLLRRRGLLARDGGPLRALYFAGLPETCERVRREVPEVDGVFCGDETPAETLRILGVPASRLSAALSEGVGYDETRLEFARDLLASGGHQGLPPPARGRYPGYGTREDTVVARIEEARLRGLPPVIRAHLGPYEPDRRQAVARFLDWTRRLARTGYLDVLSIGTSQLTQEAFGEDWTGRPNGGGVPLNGPEEYASVWEAARPMLVRTYAGTRDVPALARLYEKTINIAWHALSFWWFSRLDGRGPNQVLENLEQHFETLRFVAESRKPFEPNIPHHFAFRGADDATYVLSCLLAALSARSLGVRHLIIQNMLNTPKYLWGVQDLARSRALLRLLRELEGPSFRCYYQCRGGLDYFSHDPQKARVQLAAVTALMDDVEPDNPHSPDIIHVVSYCEGARLADPDAVDESIRITLHALSEYRRLKAAGAIEPPGEATGVRERTPELVAEVRALLEGLRRTIPELLTPQGLERAFALGYLPVPYLWGCREQYPAAVGWKTRLVRGKVCVVDREGRVLGAQERLAGIEELGRAAG
ncbi:MAG: hypothetical protein JW820_08040 [Spirochaetales bacterium]|nr:hypothetical protein [Spirochaetales bacterium]